MMKTPFLHVLQESLLDVRDRLDHVLACSKTKNIYIIGSNGIWMSASNPHQGQNRACLQIWHILVSINRDEHDIQSLFFPSGNVSSNEQSHKIEQILDTAICLNREREIKSVCMCNNDETQLLSWPWNNCHLWKAVLVWETPIIAHF